MKKILYIIVFFAFSGLALSSCDDFLDKKPTDSGSAAQAIKTVADAKVVMTGVMRSMTTSNYYGRNLIMYGDAKGGDMTVPSFGMGLDNLFTFSHRPSSGSYSGFWSSGYFILLQVNNLIQNIEKLEGAGKSGFSEIKGQALTIRALVYFDLVRLYGPPYNYNKTAYGVPLVLEPLPSNAQPSRETVENIYKRILIDLSDGKTLLANYKKNKENGYIGYYANVAIEARVKLFMDNFDGAFAAAEEVIKNGGYSLYQTDFSDPNPSKHVNEWPTSWSTQFGKESIFEIAMYTGEGALGTASLGYYLLPSGLKLKGNTKAESGAVGYYLASNAYLNLLGEDPTDVRWSMMYYDYTDTPDTLRKGACYKYVGGFTPDGKKVASLKGDGKETYATVNVKVIRLSEMYLIAAEAALLKSSPDKQAAADYLNQIRKRAPALAPATATTVTEDMILNERSKELFHEGHRFFDMMRKNKTITFQDGFYHATIPSTRPNSIDRSYYKTILPISQDEINANPALKDQQNPGDWN